jgi:tripartite-type tricarboxylate transporter receptor subunit TctC
MAVGSKERISVLPDLPTTAELGFPQVEADNWYGIVAPAGLPADVAAILHEAVVAALHSPDVTAKLDQLGAVAVGNSPEQFAAYLKSEIEKWADVVRTSNLVVK